MKGVYKAGTILLNVWPERTDSQKKYSKCKYCYTCYITFVPSYTQKHLEGKLDWDSINLCYNKGQRLGVSSTQLRSRGMIDVRLHSTSAWKEALSKQIACNQNIFCVSNCPKKPKDFLETWNDVCTGL